MKKRMLRTIVGSGAVLAMVAGLFVGLGPLPGSASSHREAPLVANDPQIDSTDLYAFTSPDKTSTVTLISNWIPFEEPAGGPNFYWFAPGVYYDINIDNNRDAKPDIIYRWIFTNHRRHDTTFLYNTGPVNSLNDPNLNFYQTYNLYRVDVKAHKTTTLLSNSMVAPVDVGTASMPNYQALRDAAVVSCGTDCKSYTGPADDPFFLDLRVFDLVYGCRPTGSGCGSGSGLSETGTDTLHGFNIHTTAIQVSKNDLAMGGNAAANPLIGVWTTAARQTIKVTRSHGKTKVTHPFVQVDRLGQPLVNEVLIPVGKKDAFNASKPVNDFAFLGSDILKPELPKDVQALYGIPAPAEPRNDLLPLAVGFTALGWPAFTPGDPNDTVPSDELRLNMSTPVCTSKCSRLGVVGGDAAGYPNGRRLTDDVIDISVQVVEGVLIPNHPAIVDQLGDGVNANDVPFGTSFPYLALPHSGSDATPHA